MMNAKLNNEASSAKAMPITLDNIQRGQIVQLAIPAVRPIKLMNGTLHESGQDYKVLGTYASLARLSRVSDCAKLMVLPEMLIHSSGGAK
jgi:hypothetical protein